MHWFCMYFIFLLAIIVVILIPALTLTPHYLTFSGDNSLDMLKGRVDPFLSDLSVMGLEISKSRSNVALLQNNLIRMNLNYHHFVCGIFFVNVI